MENIAKYSTIMDAALNIARIVLMVLGSICFIGALVVLLAPASVIYDGALDAGIFGVRVGSLTLEMAPDALRSANVRPMLSAILFLGSVQLFFALLYVRLSQRIVEEIKRGTPFTDTTSLTLRRLGQITIAASIVIPLLSSAASFGWMKALDLISAVAASPLISGVRMEFEGLNANMLFIGLALLLLSKVFEYGVSLQTQADETL